MVDDARERNSVLTYKQLVKERDYLKAQVPEAPKMPVGSQTGAPDNSSARDIHNPGDSVMPEKWERFAKLQK